MKKGKTIGLLVSRFGICASVIYVMAQAELFATVIPLFPVWGAAGLIGSTLWLLWLIIVGIKFLRIEII